jgi:Zn finger protein HypA/HybF involved in hydrogenase expression
MTTSSAAETAYCLRCKAQRPLQHPEVVQMSNNKHRLKAVCPNCGAGMSKLVKVDSSSQ